MNPTNKHPNKEDSTIRVGFGPRQGVSGFSFSLEVQGLFLHIYNKEPYGIIGISIQASIPKCRTTHSMPLRPRVGGIEGVILGEGPTGISYYPNKPQK